MKKHLHKIKGSQLRDLCIISNRYGQMVALSAKSILDSDRNKKTGFINNTVIDKDRINIKLPPDILWKFLRTCTLRVEKKRTWWWVDEIESK